MQIKERSKNTQLAINMGASLAAFIVSMGVNFFLTPYIVGSLGAAAYGFVGLANNVIGYTSLITIALNSMAGRFITISYQQGRVDDANKYFASVFYSNLILSAIIILSLGICVVFLEKMFNIPEELIWDVKLLFSLLLINSVVGLMTNIYAVATFIKNKLELSSIRTIIGNVIRAIVLILLFGLCHPYIWYLGLSGLLVTLYTAYTNFRYTRWLTPELTVKRTNFDFDKVRELIKSGFWNLVNRLSELLAQGLDLVMVNLFISAAAMGTLSLTKSVPTLIFSLFSTISAVFAPLFTQLYSSSKKEELKTEILKSIRILGFFTTIPWVVFFCYGEDFYALWLPTQDASLLQHISQIGIIASLLCMPLESLWNIFTITNNLKYNTLFLLVQNALSFVVIWLILFFVNCGDYTLYLFVVVRVIFSFAKNLYLLPIRSAKCLSYHWFTFFPPMIKSVSCAAVGIMICLVMHHYFKANTWIEFIVFGGVSVLVAIVINYFIILHQTDREFIKVKILHFKK